MYVEFIQYPDEYDVIASYEMSCLPRVGDFVELNGNDYRVSHIEWLEIYGKSNTKPEEIRPVVVVNSVDKFEKNKDLEKKLTHVEEWYAVRLETLKDWAKKNDHTEVFDILANGHLLKEPPTYAQQINILKHKLSSYGKYLNLFSTGYEMLISGLPKEFVTKSIELGKTYEGVVDLLSMWHDENDPVEQSNIVDDLKCMIKECEEFKKDI